MIATAGIPNAFAFFITSGMRIRPIERGIFRVQMEVDEGIGGHEARKYTFTRSRARGESQGTTACLSAVLSLKSHPRGDYNSFRMAEVISNFWKEVMLVGCLQTHRPRWEKAQPCGP